METRIIQESKDVSSITGLRTQPKLFDVHTNGQIIYWTRDYRIFNFIDGNRTKEDERRHINKIKASILKHGWFRSSLIIVRDKMKVCDGQNRIWALKEIEEETGQNYEIGYIVDRSLNLEKIQAMNNTTKTWSCNNYIKSNIVLGKSDYSIIRDIMKDFKLSYTSALILIIKRVPGSIDTHKFQKGEVTVPNPEETYKYAKWISSIKPYYKGYNCRNFVAAMVFFFGHPDFSMDEFLDKLSKNRDMLFPVTSITAFKKLIQDIYNYRRRDKITFIMA